MAMREEWKGEDKKSVHISETVKKKEKELLELLRQMEEEYAQNSKLDTPKFPSSLGLEKLEYQERDDFEMEAEAKKQLASKYKSEYQKILDDLKGKGESLKKEAETLKSAKEDAEKTTDETYDELEKKTNSNMLKRGIARSSIAALSEGEINEKRINAKESISQKYADEKNALEKQIAGLEEEKKAAVSAHKYEHAQLIESTIESLKKEQEKKMEEVLKYNNSITEKESKYQKELEKLMYDYAVKHSKKEREDEAYEKENGYSGEKKKEYQNRLSAAVEFYSQFDKRIVPSLLRNNVQLKSYLGNYYNTLMGMFV